MIEDELKLKFYNGMNDIICKELFTSTFSKELICLIYNALGLDNTISPEDIVLIDPNIINGVMFKTNELDVRFEISKNNSIINADIEFQRTNKKDFLKRVKYYQSAQIVDAVKKSSLYNMNVLLISICDFIVDKELKYQDFITIMKDRDINRLDGLKLDFDTKVIIQLPYINNCDKMNLVKLLKIMKSNNPKELRGDDELMNKVIDEIYIANASEEVRRKIRKREKEELDEQLAIDYIRDEAKAEGIVEEKVATAKKMKEDGLPIEMISKYTDLSKEEIEKL